MRGFVSSLFLICTVVALDVTGANAVEAQEKKGSALYDFLVMNVCVDASDKIVAQDPLHCPENQQRDIRAGESVPYYHADYAPVRDAGRCAEKGTSRRYAFPLDVMATDQSGGSFPLIAGWSNFAVADQECAWNIVNARDGISIVTVHDGYGSLLGSWSHQKWHVTLGNDYLNPAAKGVARFDRGWSFPENIPPMNGVTHGVFLKNTQYVGKEPAEVRAFDARMLDIKPTRTIMFWKRMMYAYGTAENPTKPLDSLIDFGFAKTNGFDDAAGDGAKGSERLYLTKELGYVTRWEDWHRDDQRDVMAVARKAYDNQNCGIPADIEGTISAHYILGPVIDDKTAHVYKQLSTTLDGAQHPTVHTWYMVGCHDFTNTHVTEPVNLLALVNRHIVGEDFINLFRAAPL